MSSRKRASNVISIDMNKLEQLLVTEMKKIEKNSERALKEKEKELKKQAKNNLRELKKQEKAALREKENELKKEAKAALREKDKQRREAIKRAQIKTKAELKTIAKNARKKEEVNCRSLSMIIKTAKMTAEFFGNKFSCTNFCEVYISKNGYMNPYTLEEVDENYDLEAAIRGIMYETSPSSAQHWFRYGLSKKREQIAPWLFYNKSLAIVNNAHGWKVSDSELKKAQRNNLGSWSYMEEGSQAFYDWDEDKYGPLPTKDVLKAATVGRKVGTRGNNV